MSRETGDATEANAKAGRCPSANNMINFDEVAS